MNTLFTKGSHNLSQLFTIARHDASPFPPEDILYLHLKYHRLLFTLMGQQSVVFFACQVP
jgi:hypothetical protein